MKTRSVRIVIELELDSEATLADLEDVCIGLAGQIENNSQITAFNFADTEITLGYLSEEK